LCRTFWSKVTGNTPESRLEMCRMLERQDKEKSGVKEDKPLKIRRYFDKDDQPLSCNEPKLSFSLNDDMDRNLITLDLAIPRYINHLNTNNAYILQAITSSHRSFQY